MAATATFRIWRGDANGGEFRDYTTEVSEGMVVLDAVHRDPGRRRRTTCLPLELQGRQMRLLLGGGQRHAEADVHDAAERSAARQAGDGRADEGISARQGSGDGCLVEFRGEETDQEVQAAPARRRRRHMANAQEDIDRVQEFRKCIECFLCQDVCHVLRDHQKHEEFIGPRFLVYCRRAGDASARHGRSDRGITRSARHRLLQHHQMLHEGLPREHHITDNAIIPLKERAWWTNIMIRWAGSGDG